MTIEIPVQKTACQTADDGDDDDDDDDDEYLSRKLPVKLLAADPSVVSRSPHLGLQDHLLWSS